MLKELKKKAQSGSVLNIILWIVFLLAALAGIAWALYKLTGTN